MQSCRPHHRPRPPLFGVGHPSQSKRIRKAWPVQVSYAGPLLVHSASVESMEYLPPTISDEQDAVAVLTSSLVLMP